MKIIVLSTITCSLLLCSLAISQVPLQTSFQGYLTSSSGAAAPNGIYNLQFKLYDAQSGGVLLWSEVQNGVQVQRGTLSVILGSVTPLNIAFSGNLFVDITATSGPGISAPVAFSPRSKLLSSPYALWSNHAVNADTAEYAKSSPGSGGAVGGVPIGSIVGWAKTASGTPTLQDGWVECNGQVLSDPMSPYNGQNIPNLNNSGGTSQNFFLMGGMSSGSTGGNVKHKHGFSGEDSGGGNRVPRYANTLQFTDLADGRPPYYTVVWIIRVK